MKYKVTLNNRTYEVEVEEGKAMLIDEYEAYACRSRPRSRSSRCSRSCRCACRPCRTCRRSTCCRRGRKKPNARQHS